MLHNKKNVPVLLILKFVFKSTGACSHLPHLSNYQKMTLCNLQFRNSYYPSSSPSRGVEQSAHHMHMDRHTHAVIVVVVVVVVVSYYY